MFILQWVLRNGKLTGLIISVLLILAGIMYNKALHFQINELKSKNASLEASLQVSNNSIKMLQSSLNDQNKAVQKLKADADAREKSHKAEVDAANKKALTYKQQAAAILARKPNSTDKCQSASDLIDSEIKRNAKK